MWASLGAFSTLLLLVAKAVSQWGKAGNQRAFGSPAQLLSHPHSVSMLFLVKAVQSCVKRPWVALKITGLNDVNSLLAAIQNSAGMATLTPDTG